MVLGAREMDNLMKNDKICVLHTGTDPSSGNVFLFQDITFKKCQEAELVHKARSCWATSIYKNVVLPSTPNTILGSHSKCYAKYTAEPSTVKKAVSQQTEKPQYSISRSLTITSNRTT
ncbi:hypothetical protein OUZ56_018580 [Daphnia magna]|uniref:Uncharacterized protein n=1 Tax=Daphnia magna TaxID=35525 RepID=A0ABQ9Z9A8_9CRUS|nr:hypothetical protein OUZ56_018580 [Daphnia magna]